MSWTSGDSARWRAYFRPLLPLPCGKCGRPVTDEMRWHVGHRQARAEGGGNVVDNLWPEHGTCNERDGQRLGQKRLAARRRAETGRRKW